MSSIGTISSYQFSGSHSKRSLDAIGVNSRSGQTRITCNEPGGYVNLDLQPYIALELARRLIRTARQDMSEHELAEFVMKLLEEEVETEEPLFDWCL